MVSLSKEYVSKNSEVSCHLPGNRENLLFRDFAVLALNLNGSWKSWLPLLFYYFTSQKNLTRFYNYGYSQQTPSYITAELAISVQLFTTSCGSAIAIYIIAI